MIAIANIRIAVLGMGLFWALGGAISARAAEFVLGAEGLEPKGIIRIHIGEDRKDVYYFTPEEAELGQIHRQDDGTFTDRHGQSFGADGPEFIDFVVTLDGRVLGQTPEVRRRVAQTGRRWQHSSLVAGSKVLFAGELGFDEGRLVRITSKSGHYWPTVWMFKRALLSFERAGISLEDLTAEVTYREPDRSFVTLTLGARRLIALVDRPDMAPAELRLKLRECEIRVGG